MLQQIAVFHSRIGASWMQQTHRKSVLIGRTVGLNDHFMKLYWESFVRLPKTRPSRSTCRKKLLIFAVSPIIVFRKPIEVIDNTPDILANIPKEVFKKDAFKKRSASGFIMRILTKIWDFVRLSTRFVYLVCLFSPFLWTYLLTYLSDFINTLWLKSMLRALEHAGPTFIKLGQWVGTRRDMFSQELCDMFSKLHDTTNMHPWPVTKRKLRKAFGKRWRLLFEKFEQVPVGSGCIGQVHRAYMCSDMIPDETIVKEVLSIEDSDEPGIDFAEGASIMHNRGLEVFGLKREDESVDNAEQLESEQATQERRKERYAALAAAAQVNQASAIAERETTAAQAAEGEESEGLHTNYPNEQIEIVEHLDSVEPIEMQEVTLIPVAVKVLHPGIYRSVKRDLKILRFCSKIVDLLFPRYKWLGVTECFEEFSKVMIRQIDLRYEADSLEKFVDNFKHNPNIRFPRPIRPYCKRDVLVETLEEGEPISSFLMDETEEEFADHTLFFGRSTLKETLASVGINALLQMIFVHNFVHGDLHPGNIFVQNADRYEPQESKSVMVDLCDTVIVVTKPAENPIRLVLLDVGISTSLEPSDLKNLRSVITAVLLEQDETVADLMLKHSSHNECQDVAKFKAEMSSVVHSFRENTLTLGKVQVGELLSAVFQTCIAHRVKMESKFASILLAIFVLEGIGRSLDPNLDMLYQARGILLPQMLQ